MRLFVALDLPESLKDQLAALTYGIAGVRWVPRENYHLTLRFIGEVESWQAQEIDEALAAIRARPFQLSLHGLGTFEKGGRLSALWIAAERTPELNHLQGKVETALQRVGLPVERRRFTPHVTLARIDGKAMPEKLMGFVQAHNLFRAEPVPMAHFTLFSSRLGKEQAVYEPEVEYGLE